MNVSLTPVLEKMIQEKVASGMYTSASEVVREALRLMAERDRTYREDLEVLRKEVLKGLESAKRGKFSSRSIDEIAEDVFQEFEGKNNDEDEL